MSGRERTTGSNNDRLLAIIGFISGVSLLCVLGRGLLPSDLDTLDIVAREKFLLDCERGPFENSKDFFINNPDLNTVALLFPGGDDGRLRDYNELQLAVRKDSSNIGPFRWSFSGQWPKDFRFASFPEGNGAIFSTSVFALTATVHSQVNGVSLNIVGKCK